MSSAVIDWRGHGLCDAPLETHEFKGPDHLCKICHRPRALHIRDGHHPVHTESNLPIDPEFRYRGPHPNWIKPKPDVPPQYDNFPLHVRLQAEARRQRQATDKLIAQIISHH